MHLEDNGNPWLLDLFCCEGGAAVGYHRAGFNVLGVDLNPKYKKRYPFQFVASDAIEFLLKYGHLFDAIHASPPCQAYTVATSGVPDIRSKHLRLIEPVREVLKKIGNIYVIENVPSAPLIDPVLLCGSMFDLTATDDDGTLLRLERHRLFESNVAIAAPGPCVHDRSIQVAGVYGGGRSKRRETTNIKRGGYTPAKHVRAKLIGVDHMTLKGLSQSIPPVYTEHIGKQLINSLDK